MVFITMAKPWNGLLITKVFILIKEASEWFLLSSFYPLVIGAEWNDSVMRWFLPHYRSMERTIDYQSFYFK